jgi:hypothetical protein
MGRAIAVFDTWVLMAICNVMVLRAAASGYAMATGHGIGSWGVVVGCLVEATLTVWMIAGFVIRIGIRGRLLLLMRILFAAVLTWLLWFQPQPWLDVNDYGPTKESIEREAMIERLQQAGWFLAFTAVFISLGIAHSKIMPNFARPALPALKGHGLVIIVVSGLALSLAIKFFGMLRPYDRGTGGFVIVGAVTVMLFECARRVVRVEGGHSRPSPR